MTRAGASGAVVSSAIVVAGMYAYRKLAEPAISAGVALGQRRPASAINDVLGAGAPPVAVAKFAVGFSFAYMTLALLVLVTPNLAGAMAILLMLAATLAQGQAVFTDLAAAVA